MQIELPFAGIAGAVSTLSNDNEDAKLFEAPKRALHSTGRDFALLREQADGWESLGSVLGRVVSQCDRNRLRGRATELDLVA